MISHVKKGTTCRSLSWREFKIILRFKLFDQDTCFVILVSLIAIISKKIWCNSGDVEGHQNFY